MKVVIESSWSTLGIRHNGVSVVTNLLVAYNMFRTIYM